MKSCKTVHLILWFSCLKCIHPIVPRVKSHVTDYEALQCGLAPAGSRAVLLSWGLRRPYWPPFYLIFQCFLLPQGLCTCDSSAQEAYQSILFPMPICPPYLSWKVISTGTSSKIFPAYPSPSWGQVLLSHILNRLFTFCISYSSKLCTVWLSVVLPN